MFWLFILAVAGILLAVEIHLYALEYEFNSLLDSSRQGWWPYDGCDKGNENERLRR